MRLTASQILEQTRDIADDVITDPKWSDEELVIALNSAIDEVCERTGILVESEDSMASIAISAGTSSYSYNNKIIKIMRAKLSTASRPLRKYTYEEMDSRFSGWESASQDTPIIYILNKQQRKVVLYPTPDNSYTLQLVVTRFPLADITIGDLTVYPDFPHNNEGLAWGVLKYAFRKDDEDTSNLEKSQLFEAEFEKVVSRINEIARGKE